ncbi:MAG: hypothetical protein WCK79_02850 [Actinomycetes bacterium]
MTSPTVQRPAIAISKKGLTKPGVAVLQTLLIGLASVAELEIRHGIGISTAIALCICAIGGVRFGRKGSEYVCAATPPLAFAIIVFATLIMIDGFHPSRFGVDFVAALASVAPYLIASAAYAWFNFFKSRKG